MVSALRWYVPHSQSYIFADKALEQTFSSSPNLLPTYLGDLMAVVLPTQPSDGMKKEMESLVEQLGADGIEAKRQVRPVVRRPTESPESLDTPCEGGGQALVSH